MKNSKKVLLFFIAIILVAAFLLFISNRRIFKEVDEFIESYSAKEYVKYDTDSFENIDDVKNKDVIVTTTVRDIRDVVIFNGYYYAATSGGLVKFDLNGRKVAVYTTNNGLH